MPIVPVNEIVNLKKIIIFPVRFLQPPLILSPKYIFKALLFLREKNNNGFFFEKTKKI